MCWPRTEHSRNDPRPNRQYRLQWRMDGKSRVLRLDEALDPPEGYLKGPGVGAAPSLHRGRHIEQTDKTVSSNPGSRPSPALMRSFESAGATSGSRSIV